MPCFTVEIIKFQKTLNMIKIKQQYLHLIHE